MRPLFKIETVDRDFAFRGFAPFSGSDFGLDYLTLDKSAVTVPKIAAEKGDFAVITDDLGATVFEGIVDDIERDVFTVVTLRPLLSLFDVEAYYDITPSGYIEDDIKTVLEGLFVNNSDALQNVAGLTVTASTHTAGTITPGNKVFKVYDFITTALKAYGVAVHFSVDRASASPLSVNISRTTEKAVIEADLAAVIAKNVVLGSSYGAQNKITIINSADSTERATYYRHTDGTIDQTDDDRIEPVFFTFKEITANAGSTFADKAAEEALKALAVAAYDNEIEITVLKTSKVVNAAMEIGTPVTVYEGGASYDSILTGRTISDNTVTLKFGVVRTSLTSQLIIERRSS